jgi:hypothetical protein
VGKPPADHRVAFFVFLRQLKQINVSGWLAATVWVRHLCHLSLI